MNSITSPDHPSRYGTTSDIKGTGLGLRGVHIPEILAQLPDIPWFEILADNHRAGGGFIPRQLEAIRQHYPITFHCVGMSLASPDVLDMTYLRDLKRQIRDFEPAWVSDHLSFSQLEGHHYHDLLPIPYTEESLFYVSRRIREVQDILEQRILVENVSSYVEFNESSLSEMEFIHGLLSEADCELLLDINNVYVNCQNHDHDAATYLESIPLTRVREIHLAGFEAFPDYLLDAHNNPVSSAVWDLFRQFVERRDDIPVLIEWDNNIPEFSRLREEANKADRILARQRRTQVA